MTQHLDRTGWIGILVGLAGSAFLYIGVTEYLREPALESAVTAGLGLLGLLKAKHDLLGGSAQAKEWTETAMLALLCYLLVLGTVEGARPYSTVTWIILGATLGVIVLVAGVARVLRARRKEADQEADRRLQRTRSARH